MSSISSISGFSASQDLIAQNDTGYGSPSQVPVNGSYGQSPTSRLYPGYNAPGAIKGVMNLVDLYRFNADRDGAINQAKHDLQSKPYGSAVVITQSATSYGDANFSFSHYDGVTSQSFDNANQANNWLGLPTLQRPRESSTSILVVKTPPGTDPWLSSPPNAQLITTP